MILFLLEALANSQTDEANPGPKAGQCQAGTQGWTMPSRDPRLDDAKPRKGKKGWVVQHFTAQAGLYKKGCAKELLAG